MARTTKKAAVEGKAIANLAARKEPLIYVVYDHPKDYSDYYVVRRWACTEEPDDRFFLQSNSLDTVRHFLQELGLTRLPRDQQDDPVILETWI